MVGLVWLFLGVANAADIELTHQARVVDAQGVPVQGERNVVVSLYGSADGSDLLFDDDFIAVPFDGGYASFRLGADAADRLDSSVLASATGVWVQLEVDGVVIGPRQSLVSVPYAAVATSVRGGDAEVSSLTVTGSGEVVLGQSTASSCTTAGALVFDPTIGTVKVCDGSTYRALGSRTIVLAGAARQWSDGTYARTCDAYIRPSDGNSIYIGATGDGVYRIDPDGDGLNPLLAQCDMTTEGGGWTILHSVSGADGQRPLVSNVAVGGDPFTYGQYNTSHAYKAALSGLSSETLFLRQDGRWLKMNRPAFDASIEVSGHDFHANVTLTARNGATTSSAVMGHTDSGIGSGGDYGLRNSPFDHHSTSYSHLQSSCTGHYLYSYSNGSNDSDAGYDVNIGLGDWSVTQSCDQAEGGALVFRTQVR